MQPRGRGRAGGRGSGDRGGGAPRGGAGGDGRGRGDGRGGGFRGGGERGGAFRGAERGFGDRGRGRGDRGAFRGGPGGRGGPPGPRYEAVEAPEYHPDPTPAIAVPGPTIAPGVVTVGVRRPSAPGTLGQPLTVTTNHFKITIPEVSIYHYDVVIKADKEMPIKWNRDLIRNLQQVVAPNIFTPPAGYDGRKNIYALRRLPLAGGDSQVFDVTMEPAREGGRPPKVYKVELKRVAEISPILLKRYQEGQQSFENMIQTALTALNVLAQMEPASRLVSNNRSFFTDKEVRPVGYGIELWRGFFQSIRPGLRSMLMNIDISTGMMYASGPMIDICQQVLKNNSPGALVPGDGLGDRNRITLQRFLSGVRFLTSHKDKSGQVSKKPKVLKKISPQSANNYMFEGPDGNQMSVAQYFRSLGVNLRYPNYACVETSSGAAFPIEVCTILPGQLMRKQVLPEVVKEVVTFATKKPPQRLNSVVAAHRILRYEDSEYMAGAGMVVSQDPEKCAARVLPTPALNYGAQSKSKQIRPANGSWNMLNQKLYAPADVGGAWAMVVYDGRNIRDREAQEIVHGLKAQADLLGITGMNPDPPVLFPPAQAGEVHKHLQTAGQQVFQKTKGKAPTLIVVVLPENIAADLRQAVKYFGNIMRGVPVQCITGFKSKKGGSQYWNNVILKINAKLGGVNTILDPNAQKFISDPANPVMIMGADVSHPAPGAKGRPSFASIVGSIDSNAARYSAISSVQGSRVEMIADVEGMVYELLGRHAWWKQNREKKKNCFPKRILYYRDGVSEGQFPHVLRDELPAIRAACKRHNINPTITVVVVGKRHHVRFFPTHGMADKSGNCPAGTVVDDVVGHPTEFDFYLQSHGGLLGTSRPAHYNVLFDENRFTVDSMQALSFSLCHLYARATRSVSIPAPVYYADIVCEDAKNHFDPSVGYGTFDETETTASGGDSSAVQHFKDLWKPVHESMRYKMYFQ